MSMAGGFREMEISKDARHFSLDSFANIPNSTESGIIFARLAYVKPLIPGTMLIAFGSIFRCLWQI